MNIRKYIIASFLSTILALMLVGCTAYRTKEGNVRDTIYSVEVTNNGSYKVYMTHDDVATFCTYDRSVGLKAWDILKEHDGEALLTFRSVKEGDKEWSFFNGSDCKTTAGADIHMYLLLDITAVPGR